MKLTMTLMNAITGDRFPDWDFVPVERVPMHNEVIVNFAGHTLAAVYHTWIVARVEWSLHHKGQHASVYLVPYQ